MRVTIDLPDHAAAALLRWRIPPELCGATLEERLHWLAVDWAESVEKGEADAKRRDLYRKFGIALSDDDEQDDDIPL